MVDNNELRAKLEEKINFIKSKHQIKNDEDILVEIRDNDKNKRLYDNPKFKELINLFNTDKEDKGGIVINYNSNTYINNIGDIYKNKPTLNEKFSKIGRYTEKNTVNQKLYDLKRSLLVGSNKDNKKQIDDNRKLKENSKLPNFRIRRYCKIT
jgi:hypothetical protein